MLRLAIALLILSWSAAAELGAASSADLAGTWVVDTDATWERLKKIPEVAALPPEQLPLVKSTYEGQFKTATFSFTADKLVATVNGERKEEAYKITRTEGDALYTEDTSSDGKVTHSRIDVGSNQLVVTNTADPTQAIVLKRKSDAAAK
jgi:hypothetical protein